MADRGRPKLTARSTCSGSASSRFWFVLVQPLPADRAVALQLWPRAKTRLHNGVGVYRFFVSFPFSLPLNGSFSKSDSRPIATPVPRRKYWFLLIRLREASAKCVKSLIYPAKIRKCHCRSVLLMSKIRTFGRGTCVAQRPSRILGLWRRRWKDFTIERKRAA